MAQSIQRHISHLKSSGSAAPASGANSPLIYGEIAVGYGTGDEALYIRNSSDEIVKFTTAAGSQAIAELYTDKRVISTVSGDDVVSGSLNAVDEKSTSGRTLTLVHKNNYTTQSGFKKLTSDAYGHITGGEDVTTADLVGKGALSGVTADQGLSATTKADGSQKISHTNQIVGGTASGTATSTLKHGDSFNIPSITYDANGHITTTSVTTLTLPGADNAITSVNGASGITATTTDGVVTVGHTHNISAGSAQTTSTAVTVTADGTSIDIPTIGYDANGHITSTAVKNVSLKVNSAATGTAGVVKIATATGNNDTDTVMTQKAVSDALAEKALASSAITNAEYDSTNKLIKFTNANGTQVDSINAADFIKDGMVDNVEISGTSLVVTFNTDSGKDPISIPLSSIFDPSNYYQKSDTSGKTEISTALSAKADTATTITAGTGLTGGGDLSTDRTISLATVGTAGSYYKVETDAYGRVSAGTTTLSTSDISDFSTEMAKKANTATTLTGYGITDAYTKDELTGSSAVVIAKASSATTAASASNANSAATAAVAESVALANVTNADDLKAIEALDGTSGLLKKTAANTWELDTNTYLTDADAVTSVTLSSGSTNGTLKLTVDGVNGSDVAVPGLGGAAFLNTGTTAGTVAAGDHTHSEYKNQNAFSNVKVGSSTIEADSATDTVEFAAAENSGISITADTTNDKLTFGLGDIICGDYA